MKMFVLVFLSVLLAKSTAISDTVTTTEGRVQGALAFDGDYYEFYGIRYAADPRGVDIFKAPSPPPSYFGVFRAVNHHILCTQPLSINEGPSTIIGTEACLRVNIFTPTKTTGNPVVVWLAGDEYTISNTQQYSFKRLMKENVTVVVVNYRLSALGFMCLGIEEAPGNAGLKDVVQALKWIKNNIDGFGGNPNNILLLGHGSGAAMVDLVTMSPLAKGLVHKAIVQSGSALAPWAVSYDPITPAANVAAVLGYNTTSNDTQRLVQTLFSTPPSRLISIAVNQIVRRPNVAQFAPCIENKNLDPDNRFLTDAPMKLLTQGDFMEIPYIASFVDKEGSVRVGEAINGVWLQEMERQFEQFLPIDLIYSDSLKSDIRTRYFGNKTITMNQIENYIEYHGDTLTMMSVIRGAETRARWSSSDNRDLVRLLDFSYDSRDESNWLFPGFPASGVRHGEILNYLFNENLQDIYHNMHASDILVGRYMNFARTGIPDAPYPFPNEFWPPVNMSTGALCISGGKNGTNQSYFEDSACHDPQMSKALFWDPLYTLFYRYPPMVDSGQVLKFAPMLSIVLFVIIML